MQTECRLGSHIMLSKCGNAFLTFTSIAIMSNLSSTTGLWYDVLQEDADLQSTVQQQSSEIASLREQCSNHAKERAALKTILDAKIKALVDDIGQSVSHLPPEVSLPSSLLCPASAQCCCHIHSMNWLYQLQQPEVHDCWLAMHSR